MWLRYGGLAETGPWNATGRFSRFPAERTRGKIEKNVRAYSMQEAVRNDASACFKIRLFFFRRQSAVGTDSGDGVKNGRTSSSGYE